MRADQARYNMVTFRATRGLYWALKDEARQLNMPFLTYVYWMVLAAHRSSAGLSITGKALWIRDRLNPSEQREFTGTVHKCSDILYSVE